MQIETGQLFYIKKEDLQNFFSFVNPLFFDLKIENRLAKKILKW